ncbi:MAG: molybdenum ABC transporter ATP-binding protein [Sinobacteraceae bacterium]|nr:molybdenum ABC transporter ATP-binding protein [Nevskiaceae bacterium]
MQLRLERESFTFDIEVALPARGISCVFGASGSGKTTLLRCVAGLETEAEGRVSLGETVWQDSARRWLVPTWQRRLGYIFQEASLFEHLDVQGNLDYGLRRSNAPADAATLAAAIELLGIGSLLRRRPEGLSGGERQRVAIARALASQPRLLLLDEPLASLDAARRRDILPWLERLRDEIALPMLYVTHSMEEVARLADHLLVLENGRVKASGPAGEVLASVENPSIVGEEAGVLLSGQIALRDELWQLSRVDFPGGSLWVRDQGWQAGQMVRLRVLARDVSLAVSEPRDSSIQNQLRAVITAVIADDHPSQVLVRLDCSGSALLARVTRRALQALSLAPGTAVWALVKSVAVIG